MGPRLSLFDRLCVRFSDKSFILLASQAATAETLSGRVVGISDGDTLTVLVDRKQMNVRIADIGAPEAKQAFGTRSWQALATLCHQKPAPVIDRGLDRYGRTIGVVSCAGWDAATEQDRAGMAWVFTGNAYFFPQAIFQ
jgi:endonuclease YncB( thermonuclease family)